MGVGGGEISWLRCHRCNEDFAFTRTKMTFEIKTYETFDEMQADA